jgi:hypothetical protein
MATDDEVKQTVTDLLHELVVNFYDKETVNFVHNSDNA